MRTLLLTLLALSLALTTSTARATPPLTVDIATRDIEPAGFAQALAGYVGTPVAVVVEGARLRVETVAPGTLRLSYVGDDGLARTRDLRASNDRDETSAETALVAANLVRDEASEVLGLLATPPTPAPRPVVAPPAPPRAAPRPATPPRPTEWTPVGVDFVPMVGFSSAYQGRERRNFSFGVLGSVSNGVDGFALSSVVDLALGDVSGFQLSGVVGLAGGRVRGVQLSTIDLASGGVEGLQLGVIDVAGGNVSGVQLGVIDVVSGRVDGVQLGVVNVAGGVDGVQLGVVNVAGGRTRGLQLGVVNIADDADAQVGVVSVSAHGHHQLRIGGDTGGLLGAEMLIGARYTHSIVSARVDPFERQPTVALGVGFGARIPFTEDDAAHLDIDALYSVLLDGGVSQSVDQLVELRVVGGFRLVPSFGVYVGLSYQFEISARAGSLARSLNAEDFLTTHVGGTVYGWPALLAGIELF